MTQNTAPKTYAIIGGTSGMGFGLAQKLIARGDRVLVGGRSVERLEAAKLALGDAATVRAVDMSDRSSLASFFDGAGPLVGLFTPGATYKTGSFRDLHEAAARSPFEAKFWGQYWAVHAALLHLSAGSAVVLMSGAASVRPLGNPAYAACNAAIEGLTRALAQELAPIRVNCLSPGTVDSELWRNRPAEVREPAYEAWNRLSITGRPVQVDEATNALLMLLDNGGLTGSTLYLDGGYSLR